MKLFLILLFLVFPLGQLGRYNFSGTEIVIHLNDLVVALFVAFSFLKNSKKIIAEIKTNPLSKPILIFILTMAISLAVNFNNYTTRQLFISALYPLRWISYAGLYFCFLVMPSEQKSKALKALSYCVLAVAIVGILQFIFLPDVSFLKAFNWDDHYFRAVSTFLDPGFTGAILVLGLIVFFETQPEGFKLAMLLIYISFVLTYSRASYLIYLVSFALFSLHKKSVKIFIIAALLLAVTIPLLPKSTGEGTRLQRENSIWARVHNWQESIGIWQSHPIFGVGYDAYRYSRSNMTTESHSGAGADSSILLVLATTGLVGLSAYLFLLFKIWQNNRRSVLVIASFGAVIVHSFFNNTLFYPWVMEWLWILLAISTV